MRTHPDRNKITNCLGGVEDMFYAEVAPSVDVLDGDMLLLCSDGFWSPLEETELTKLHATSYLQTTLGELIDVAIYREGARADNTTAGVARLGAGEQEHATESPVCVILEEGAPA
jgi:protein phosphatase